MLCVLITHVKGGGLIKLLASRVLGKIFEQKCREIAKCWRKLYNEDVHKT
jgi:hypothetical protein